MTSVNETGVQSQPQPQPQPPESAEEAPYSPQEAACAALTNPDPDGPQVRIRAAYRDLSCSGSGPECYRRVRYPGRSEDEWPDCDRLPASGFRASERRASTECLVPVGTLVISFERSVYRGQRGRCSVSFSVVVPKAPGSSLGTLVECEHRTLRSRPVYEITLPNGQKTEVSRRQ
jgi:hypothetical protein